MYCTQCGQPVPEDANFCPRCGTPVHDLDASEPAGGDSTTAAIEIGAFDRTAHLEGVPELGAGTGMLVVVRGPNAGSRYLVDRDTTTVGRHPESHIFLDDVTVSRHHAEIHRSDDDLTLQDLGSLNGTYVNGERVEQRLLRTGDEVQVGRFKLMYVGADVRGGSG